MIQAEGNIRRSCTISTVADLSNKAGNCIEISKNYCAKNKSLLYTDSFDSEYLDDYTVCRMGRDRANASFADLEQFCVSWGGCYKGVLHV